MSQAVLETKLGILFTGPADDVWKEENLGLDRKVPVNFASASRPFSNASNRALVEAISSQALYRTANPDTVGRRVYVGIIRRKHVAVNSQQQDFA